MSKLYYMGLEPYEGRYTLQLQHWSEAAFTRRGIDYEVIHGDILDDSKAIVTGQVLDAHGRSYYSLTQMANLIKKMKAGEITFEDTIFFEECLLLVLRHCLISWIKLNGNINLASLFVVLHNLLTLMILFTYGI